MEHYNIKQHKQEIPMSAGYIYGNRVSSDSKRAGMNVRAALKDACSEGSVPYEKFPFNKEVPEIFEMVAREKEKLAPQAKPYCFTSYVKVSTIDEIKTALYNGYPVIFSITWYKGAKVKNGILTTDFKTTSSAHCMVIYGWNKDGWKFQNSWGRSWGDGGRAILPYNYKISQAFSIIDEIVGDIQIKKPFKSNNIFVRLINKINILFYKIQYAFKY